MQLVQTRIRLLPPPTFALTGRRLTFQRRRLMLCAWEMLLPNCGPLPQTSHTCAISNSRTRLETCTRRNRHAENPAEYLPEQAGTASRVFSVSREAICRQSDPAPGILLAATHESDPAGEQKAGRERSKPFRPHDT